MELREITIQNFRQVHEATFTVQDYSLLVGANNAGKSTVVDCLRAFYRHQRYEFNAGRDFPKDPARAGEESFIELTYSLTDDEVQNLPEKYRLADNILKVKKWFCNQPEDREANAIYGYETTGQLSEDRIFGAANVQKGRLGKVVYIPAVSKVDEHTKLTGPSALRDAIAGLMKTVISGSPAYEEFAARFETFVQTVRTADTEDGRSIEAFGRSLSGKLEGWSTRFELVFTPPAAQEITKHMIDWQLTDLHGQEIGHGIDQFGSGFQRHLIAAVIQTSAEFGARPAATRRTFAPDLTLLLFEEPEAYLHPPQQAQLARDLRAIASNQHWQVIASTHSPLFVSRNTADLQSLVRLRNDGGVTTCYQLRPGTEERIFSARAEIEAVLGRWEELSDEDRAQLERVRYFLWLDNERCSLFFSDLVLLVEGATELALFSRLLDDGRLVLRGRACSVLHSDGKFNTIRFMRLLNALGLPFVVIHDRDDERRPRHARLNQLIAGEAADSDFCLGVEILDPDLESFLEWPAPGEDRRYLKPAMILLNYEERAEETPQLNDLCSRLRDIVA